MNSALRPWGLVEDWGDRDEHERAVTSRSTEEEEEVEEEGALSLTRLTKDGGRGGRALCLLPWAQAMSHT